MKTENLVNIIDADFFAGVPDSQLKSLCDYLMNRYGIDPKHHIIAANEGNCAAIAAGYHLATGRVPVVYMQNSGEGNVINPIASLLNEKVYAIPMIFIIGWRGEPGIHDEPQHVYQGIVTQILMNDMSVETFVIGKDTSEEEVRDVMSHFKKVLGNGGQVAFIIRKGALEYDLKVKYKNAYKLNREEVIRHILTFTGKDSVVSTTGKISRELFEIRTQNEEDHGTDFLTVGSMGHCSSIALGIALNKPEKKIWCLDGDGAVLMHMGAMAVIGANSPSNFVHIVINNEAHETVGGMYTVAKSMDLVSVSRACGYEEAVCVSSLEDLDDALKNARKNDKLTFIEVKCQIGSRKDLGRPTISALDNKKNFMNTLNDRI